MSFFFEHLQDFLLLLTNLIVDEFLPIHQEAVGEKGCIEIN
jgi:hypothetical protein